MTEPSRDSGRVAIVGMACRYPDAASPGELWENAVAGRRAFRRLPDQRMRLADYWDGDPAAPDRFYARNAAVIEGYDFDRVGFRIAGSTYRSTDLTHWLALDVAAQALADAGFPLGDGLPRERTGVVVGNTLTGEFARANLMRLRWPYVRRVVGAALGAQGWDDDKLAEFLGDLETVYKEPFPPIDEDTLAGGLANTIAGRICNYFDLKGGGFTVDGACSSSLLSVITACRSLGEGELDVAVAGGVDLSIDPFEIIGFAKTGALARGEMRVYDRGSNGFWPGEGCGMVVLMREADALAARRRIYATVAGWGVSSDGKGGITRPEVDGYRLALRRAYERAGFGIETIGLFEGHGTGTEVGDKTELTALSQARLAAAATGPAGPAAIGSIKGMIGHTKAAAGVAGLIKATMAVHEEVLPPAIGCVDQHAILTEDGAPLRALRKAEAWPAGTPVRAAVTAMGFGGINTHIVLDRAAPRRRPTLDSRTRQLAASAQDVELLVCDGASPAELRERLSALADHVATISYAQLADLATRLQGELRDLPYRAAAVVSSPEDAERRFRRLVEALDAGETRVFDGRTFLGHAARPGRIGYLFPGQGSGQGTSGGALRRRLTEVDEVYTAAALPTSGDMVATAVAQPRIVTGSMAGLRAMSALGLDAVVAVGHSLGEISALHWAGVLDERSLLHVAAVRGQTMAEHSASGTMAGVSAPPETVAELVTGLPVVIAGYNGPGQTVIAGTVEAIEEAGRRAEGAGVSWIRLRVSHAFHSPLVAPAADVFRGRLADVEFGPVGQKIVSTVTGDELPGDTDVPGLLRRQITEPVLFAQAVTRAAKDVDLFVEVGPGRVLSGLAAQIGDVPSVALDTDGESLAGLLGVAAAGFVVGAPVRLAALFHDRLTRPLPDSAGPFFASPCEQAPDLTVATIHREIAAEQVATTAGSEEATVDVLRRLAAERAELPLELVRDDSRLLDDLHLSSITVGQILNQATRELGVSAVQGPTAFATATVRELADALDELAATAHDGPPVTLVEGAAAWARPFYLDLDELPRPPAATGPNGTWTLHAPAGQSSAEDLRKLLERSGVGSGVLVWLPKDCAEAQLSAALAGAVDATASAGRGETRFVLVQHGSGAAGLAKTLHLEAPQVRTTIVHLPEIVGGEALDWVAAEVAATGRFAEAHYDESGVRRVPTLRVMPMEPARTSPPLDASDVLLVTGGGKGITAECALALAADSGAALALLGRSDPADDAELAANLRRMADRGVNVRYVRADVGDVGQVRAAVDEVRATLGEVTAVLHGAGRNEPRGVTALDMAEFRRTFAPKVDGLEAVLDAVDQARLRLLVTFGSIIGRAGLRGEGHYATANEWLADRTRAFAWEHPDCRTLCMEWSVWSGVGMGERLSVIESLTRDGITPISPDQGVAILRRLVADPDAPTVVVISGRTEGIATVRYDLPALPLLRFVDRPLIRYHGVELVAETELNPGADLYLADHDLDGNLLFPAVFGMEAMAQVATAATGWSGPPAIELAEFSRPIVVPPDGSTVIRVAATVTGPDTAEVAIRSAETGFAADHFRARLRFGGTVEAEGAPGTETSLPPVPLDPAADMYGGLLFQGARFQRLRRYHVAAARDVEADVAVNAAAPSASNAPAQGLPGSAGNGGTAAGGGWFAGFLSDELLLGDPGTRDALMHGLQVCVPDATLLPAGIERIQSTSYGDVDELRLSAAERYRDGDTYVYDVALRNRSGQVVERWDGLRLQAVRKGDGRGPWVPPLLGPHLERAVEDVLGTRLAVVVEPDDKPLTSVAARRRATSMAIGRAVGAPVKIRYRPDGRPEPVGDGAGASAVSAAHGAGVTLAVASKGMGAERAAAPGTVACDIEAVAVRSADDWTGLLGAHAPLAELLTRSGESRDRAATRVWTAVECLRKAGLQQGAPLAVSDTRADGWTVFASGSLRIATFVTRLRHLEEPVVVAVLAERQA
ncbi:SDR family NAD(P)-dependent oxidoreductase [Streptosporangiaceae bacterium NEAU-GS5]|nr:SDR family NAD(P)-dependent oxidoreductase [Streptosporangiaceae bacterium NEAU-GS5]